MRGKILYISSHSTIKWGIVPFDSSTVIRMAQDDLSAEETAIVKQLDPIREEFIVFLTSTGRIRPRLASSMYDSGLNSYDLLKGGDLKYFRSFNGVGERTAHALFELGRIRERQELESARMEFRSMLKGKGIRSNIIDILEAEKLDSVEKIIEKGPQGLVSVRGIGNKTADSLISACDAVAMDAPVIEEAGAEPAQEEAEAPRSPGMIDRIVAFFKGLFSGKKEDPAGESGSTAQEGEAPGDVKETGSQPAETEKPPEIGIPVIEKAEEEAVAIEAVPDPVETTQGPDVAENIPESLDKEEIPEGSTPKDPLPEEVIDSPDTSAAVEPHPEIPGEEGPPRAGFMVRIRSFFSKKSPAQEPAPPETETSVVEDTKEVDADDTVPEATDAPAVEDNAEPEPTKEPLVEEAAPPIEILNMEDIPGIGPEMVKVLQDAGYRNIDELREAVPEDLLLIKGVDPQSARNICSALNPKK